MAYAESHFKPGDGRMYQAKVIDIYDADTFTVQIDLGFHLVMTETVRLYGIDTPELRTKNGKEKKLGYEAKNFASNLLLNKTVNMEIYDEDKYGRYLVDVRLGDTTLTQELIKAGYGYAYFGGTKEKWKL
jgi:micrococcal nuclease